MSSITCLPEGSGEGLNMKNGTYWVRALMKSGNLKDLTEEA
jgi:hypothetical protein